MKPVFVSCFTPDQLYRDAALWLKASLDRFNLSYEIREYQPLGDWRENTLFKPIFIKKMLDKYRDRPLVWVDADAEIQAYPELLMDMTADVATGYLEKKREYLSGTVYLANNHQTRKLLDLWVKRIHDHDDPSPRKEQRALGWAIEKLMNNGLLYERLPFEYVRIFDLKGRDEVPIILHRQLSRKAKRLYG
jgi:hypothetical protein